jgi:hypothetical protein
MTEYCNGYVNNGIPYEQCSFLVLNPGYELSDWGKDNAVQFQGEVTLDADCNFTVEFPLNYNLIGNRELYQALYFKAYCCGTTTAKGGFYVSDTESADGCVYQGIAYGTLKYDDTKLCIPKDGLVLPEGEITVYIPISLEGAVSKTVSVYYAVYDNEKNMLLSLNTMEKEVSGNQGWVEYASDIKAEENQIVKCYVWEQTLNPALYTLD